VTFKDKYKSEEVWDKKIMIISLYHNTMLLTHKRWRMIDTAKYFCKSLASISEDLKIAKALHEGLEFNSRKHALKIIRNGNDGI
jgi:hypothetical protein